MGCGQASQRETNAYDIQLSFDGENTLHGQEFVKYINLSDNTLSFLQFNLFANAFQDKNNVLTVAEEERGFYEGESRGKIQIQEVSNGERNLEYDFHGEYDEIMIVTLPQEIYPNESVKICITFTLTLANINHRLGRGEHTINLGNFYPIVSVYENGKGFYSNSYQPFGDPFYSQVASYSVKIDYPEEFDVSASGVSEGTLQTDNRKKQSFKGENMRDFALVLSKRFSSVKTSSSVREIQYYGYDNDSDLQECLNLSKHAVEYFSQNFSDYPYKKLSVVKNSFLQGGMEYPALVMISDRVDKESLPYVIVHEIAHQWWYAVVGNNQYEHAWIDEGLAEYSTLMFFRDNTNYGIDFQKNIDACINSYKIYEKVQKKVYGKVDGVMDKKLDKFLSSPDYVAISYTKATLMFNNIEETLGRRKFLICLKDLYEKFAFKEISPAHIIASFSSSSHRDMEGIFTSWLKGKVVLA